MGNILILGDSYSTFNGYIPEGYACFYDENSSEYRIHSVHDTWWYQLLEHTQSKLLQNNSYSGSTICNTGYDGVNAEASSFISRVNELIENNFFSENVIDLVLVFGGTNDDWAGSPIGTEKTEHWSKDDLRAFAPAVHYLFARLKEALPEGRICAIVNTELRQEIEIPLLSACDHYDIPAVRLHDIEKVDGHPTALGMRSIEHQVFDVVSRL